MTVREFRTKAIQKGFGFGLTSGVTTTLGLMMGLYSGTHSRLAVIGGIITIAVADAFSDAFGVHVSEESDKNNDAKYVWAATFFTLLFKFIFAVTFVVPVLIFESLDIAVWISFAWGVLLLSIYSIRLANQNKETVWKVVLEHVFITILVVCITYLLGLAINTIFGEF